MMKDVSYVLENVYKIKDGVWATAMSKKDILEIVCLDEIGDEFAEYESCLPDPISLDPISLNVLNYGDSIFLYNEEEKTLYINGVVNILDGFYRLLSYMDETASHPVLISYLDMVGVRDLMQKKGLDGRIIRFNPEGFMD